MKIHLFMKKQNVRQVHKAKSTGDRTWKHEIVEDNKLFQNGKVE